MGKYFWIKIWKRKQTNLSKHISKGKRREKLKERNKVLYEKLNEIIEKEYNEEIRENIKKKYMKNQGINGELIYQELVLEMGIYKNVQSKINALHERQQRITEFK